MIDTHAHLHDAAFAEDRAEVVSRALEAGITTMINIGTDMTTSAAAIAVSNQYGTAVAIGIHPHDAIDAPDDLHAAFAPLRAAANTLVAIGEIGLDFHYDHSPRDVQAAVLRKQLALAADYDLPVIFHEREALDTFVEILREERARRAAANLPQLRGVIHCFTRDTDAAKIYTQEFGLHIGIGGVLTFKTAQGLRDAIVAVGLDKVILETDCPYLAPVPHRGKRNEPAFVTHTAEKLSEILSMSVADIVKTTTLNAQNLFVLPQQAMHVPV
jgi:TatD DNase family protein